MIPFSLHALKTLMAISPLLQHINLLIGFGKGVTKRGSMVSVAYMDGSLDALITIEDRGFDWAIIEAPNPKKVFAGAIGLLGNVLYELIEMF